MFSLQADELWEKLGLSLDADMLEGLRQDLLLHKPNMREAAAMALAAFLRDHPSHIKPTLDWLIQTYR